MSNDKPGAEQEEEQDQFAVHANGERLSLILKRCLDEENPSNLAR
jgi:hypothetical protein